MKFIEEYMESQHDDVDIDIKIDLYNQLKDCSKSNVKYDIFTGEILD